ncbi:MAG: hypothetical protein KGI28_02025 [Thaumarchaeota archaeon]|nr:hypothetical protein [Nitrososphaerota archaeon]
MSDYEDFMESVQHVSPEENLGSNSETQLYHLSLISRLQLDDEESGLKDEYLDQLKQSLEDGIGLDFTQLEYLQDRCDFLDEKQFCDLNKSKTS